MTTPVETKSIPTTLSNSANAFAYYNKAQDQGLAKRNESKILHLRNFNNWIKSNLISNYLQRLKNEQPARATKIHVFDMGCGKGGDQPKWDVGRVNFVTFADLAENSVEVCKQRYYERRKCCYEAEFFPLDCTKELTRDKIKATEPCFDLISTQFVLHYSFETFKSANRFLRNAAEFLRVGGYFIGTTVNSCELIERCRNSPSQSISNDVFSVKFDPSIDISQTSEEPIPLFGAKYHFSLDEVVDCPEYLVYFPLLEQLARKHGLKRVERQTFKEFFEKNKNSREGRFLLEKMKALEYYELSKGNSNQHSEGNIEHDQFKHAARYIKEKNEDHYNSVRACRTLSKKEWEITGLYITFAFQKTHHVKYGDMDDTPLEN